jgi:DNA-binding transcriptional LysR family regulator
MDVSLHQLRVFAAVAETLSFSRAAEALILTQPAVSMQVKSLERNVGIPLFDHIGKRIQLTEAGRELYVRATEILGLSKAAVEAMVDLREGRAGKLRVVATTTVGIYVVPRLLGEYHRRNPGVEIRMEVANWERTCQRLFAGEADVAVAGPHPHEGLRREPFMDDELVVIAAPDHRLARRAEIPLEEIAAEPMVVREAGSGTRGAVEVLFEQHGLPLHRAMELSRNGAVKQVVMAGLGLAVISRAAISLELANRSLCVLDVEGFPMVRAWHIITRSGIALSPAAAAFCRELREGAADRMQPLDLAGIQESEHRVEGPADNTQDLSVRLME